MFVHDPYRRYRRFDHQRNNKTATQKKTKWKEIANNNAHVRKAKATTTTANSRIRAAADIKPISISINT